MARPLRIEYPGAYYHIFTRGHRKDLIFYANRDRQEFLRRLKETAEKYQIRIHAYVLMNNHYHLLVETLNGNLTKGMHYLNASYSNLFRIKHNLVGSIFQGRYKAILVEKDAYLLELSAYIHLNPLRGGITESYDDFSWSSFPEYCHARQGYFPYTLEILSLIGGTKAYRKFVASRIAASVRKESIYGTNSILGGEDFKHRVLKHLSEKKLFTEDAQREIGELRRLRKLMEEDVRRIIIELFEIKKASSWKRHGAISFESYICLVLKNIRT